MNLGAKESEVASKDRAPSSFALFCLVVSILTMVASGKAQVRGVYPLGMSATNSGVTPEPGFTYSNAFLFYSRDQLKDANGEVIAPG
jgi:hypothetical protein